MDHHEKFRRAATERGVPEDESARFADLIRFRIRAGERPDGIRAGRYGGMPHLPVGMPWPSVTPGAPLAFMASLDCAALPRIGLALPEEGTLLFFLAPAAAVESCSLDGEQKFARVVHVPAGTDTVLSGPPADGDDEPRPDPGHDLFARVEADLPEWLDEPEDWRSDFQRHLTRDMPHGAELGALVPRLWPDRIPWIGQDVLVGGYSISAQDSPETRLASADPTADEPRPAPGTEGLSRAGQAERRVMREWVPLAQFAVPHEQYIKGRFLIRHDDLAAGRFDKALSFCEFTE